MKRKLIFPIAFGITLASFTGYAAADTFVIERQGTSVSFNSDFFEEEFPTMSEASSYSSSSSNGSSSKTSSSKESSSENSVETPVSSETSTSSVETSTSSESSSTEESSKQEETPLFTAEEVLTDTSFSNPNVNITIQKETIKEKNKSGEMVNTVVFTADVYVRTLGYLRTALAKDQFGLNIKEKTSAIAKRNGAIFAVNGDFYGAQEKGYVLRNGTTLRDTSKDEKNDSGDLAIYKDGTFESFKEVETPLSTIAEKGAYQVFSFGPTLVLDGVRVVDEEAEVAVFDKKGNQRCAIGMIDPHHYIFVVCDARIASSWGMDLYQMGDYLVSKGVKHGYNLDGGGSATFFWNGKVMNHPTTDGIKFEERKVSDIVYIAK